MTYEDYITQSLYLNKLPVYESDIPFIHRILHTTDQAKKALHAFSDLNLEVPITIVDKEMMK